MFSLYPAVSETISRKSCIYYIEDSIMIIKDKQSTGCTVIDVIIL